MVFSSNVLKRWSFQKNCNGIWSFFYYLERWYFFPENKILGRKWKMIFLKKYMEIWFFLYMRTDVTKINVMALCQKKSKMIFPPKKIHFKVIDILGWHSRKSSSDSLYFYGDLYRRFHALLFREKTRKLWLLLQLIWLEIFYNEESSLLCTIQPSGVIFIGVLERQSRKLFVH